MVTARYSDDSNQFSEVIDLVNPNSTCAMLQEFPEYPWHGFGGLLNTDMPIICGGLSPHPESKCYRAGHNQPVNSIRSYTGCSNSKWYF